MIDATKWYRPLRKNLGKKNCELGDEAFLRREVLPYAADGWYQPDSVKVGYEISFTRYFYEPKPMRTLAETQADILALEGETEGLLVEIVGHGESGSSR